MCEVRSAIANHGEGPTNLKCGGQNGLLYVIVPTERVSTPSNKAWNLQRVADLGGSDRLLSSYFRARAAWSHHCQGLEFAV